MTRKDFELITSVLSDVRPPRFSDNNDNYWNWLAVVKKFSERLKTTNGAFKPGKFEDACGVHDE